ncbi:transglycosylase family protein [Streptomyces sp. NPDC001922]|uniref:LysM peptidoglycan-binding domain-containing protein n=1 Tax=Streptomyces sp. NPDC001922 TaxID=3364624 RepID=UPI0036CF2ED5
MRSGNGRHRRPRQAPAIFVTVGMTGAGIAMPLLGATGAQAADADTWDRVAQCESGGLWSADAGNGFYGGLQFTQEMWEEYGGRDYAPRADLASRSQQISVAEKVLADRGPEAWPSCATNAGLQEGGEAPDVDPGSTEPPGPLESLLPLDPEYSDGASSSGRADDADRAKSGDADDDEADGKQREGEKSGDEKSDGADGDKSGDDKSDDDKADADRSDKSDGASGGKDGSGKDGSDQDGEGTGRHRGSPADEKESGDEERDSGRHASRGEDRADTSADGRYTVQPGDSLSDIAQEYALPGGWSALYASNEDVVGSDADVIRPGQNLDLVDSEG